MGRTIGKGRKSVILGQESIGKLKSPQRTKGREGAEAGIIYTGYDAFDGITRTVTES